MFFPANMSSAHFSTFVPRNAFCCSSCFARCSHRCCPRSRPKKSTFPEDPSLPGTIPSESLPCGHLIWVLFQEVRAHWLVLWVFASIYSAAAGTCQGLAWPKATAGPAQCTHHGRRLKRSPSLTPKPSKNFLALVSNWETAWTCLGLRTESHICSLLLFCSTQRMEGQVLPFHPHERPQQPRISASTWRTTLSVQVSSEGTADLISLVIL